MAELFQDLEFTEFLWFWDAHPRDRWAGAAKLGEGT
jgi:hypothetical protein